MTHHLEVLFFCFLVALPSAGQVRGAGQSRGLTPAALFAQNFYDWYALQASKETSQTTSDIALQQRASSFCPELKSKLRADSEAQSKASGDIVGLDFDPFTYSQDPAKHYHVENVAARDKRYVVEVHRVISGKVEQKSTVTAEIAEEEGHACFANFIYPNGLNLVSLLDRLQKSRNKSSR